MFGGKKILPIVLPSMVKAENFSAHLRTWTSLDGKIHNHNDRIFIDRRWHSSTLDLRSFRGADCVTDHYLVVVEAREKLAVSNQVA
jgi:hypothetical protein